MSLESVYRTTGSTSFRARAAARQSLVLEKEQRIADRLHPDWTPAQARDAAIKTRQDMILLESHLHDLNIQLRLIKYTITIGLLVIILLLFVR